MIPWILFTIRLDNFFYGQERKKNYAIKFSLLKPQMDVKKHIAMIMLELKDVLMNCLKQT